MSAKFTMRLRSVGNPDFRQYAPISEPETITGSSLAEMRDLSQAYIQKWDLGGGNWPNPVVKQGRKTIGYFSYNGRLWDLSANEILIDAAPAGGVL